MKLEAGMYVKTKKGKIARIIDKIDNSGSIHESNIVYKLDDNSLLALNSKKVIKASHNIIDLIERGDILHDKNNNEYWTVQRVEKDEIGNISIQTEWEGFESEEELLDAIDEIITKEQAKNISYKIGDE